MNIKMVINTLRPALLLFIGLLAGFSGFGQHYLGVRGGYGNGSVRFYPPQDTKALWGLYSGGISWKYYSAERVLGGLEFDLLYLERGYRQPESGKPDTVTIHTLSSIELPLCWQPHVYFAGRRVRVFLNLGLTFSYNFGAWEEQISKRDGVIYSIPYDMKLTRDNRWGYGLCGGFGINYIVGRLELMTEARYDFGYADLYKNRNKYETNPIRSPIDNFTVCFGVYFRLGQVGLLSPATGKAQGKMSRRESAAAERRDAAAAAKMAKTPPSPAEPAPAVERTEEQMPVAPEAEDNTPKENENGQHTPIEGSETDTEGHQ